MSGSDFEHIVLPEIALVLDVQHFPVLIVTWFGVPVPALVPRYTDWLMRIVARAETESTRLVLIDDVVGLTERPDPEARRTMAQALKSVSDEHAERLLGASVVVSNPFVRAAITVVMSLTRRPFDIKPARDMEQALAHARRMLEQAGLTWPEGLDAKSYRRPDRPA
ncbi:MAG: hypothetical protein AAGF11_37120 [Myxococcota bacterium]